MSIMEELYNGKIYPSEQVLPADKGYREANRKVDQLISKLEGNLSKEDYAKMDKICDCLTDTQDIMCMEFFRLGLSMGLLLMKEAVDNPYLSKNKNENYDS